MTREEIKTLLPIMQAYADGAKLQALITADSQGNKEWVDIINPDLETFTICRIKPKPTYRPFKNTEECWNEMQKHQPFGWLKMQGQYRMIVRTVDSIFQLDKADNVLSFEEGLRYCRFADGTPFGIIDD